MLNSHQAFGIFQNRNFKHKNPVKNQKHFQIVYVKCPYLKENTNQETEVTFLGIDKLYAKNEAVGPKICWLLSLLIATGLCLWQVWLCLEKFIEEPTGNIVEVEKFMAYTMPAYTACASSDRFGYNFFSAFDKFCNSDSNCKKLDENQRKNIPFKDFGFDLNKLWMYRFIDGATHHRRCFHAVNETECNLKTWNTVYNHDTILGPCQTFYNDEKWAYAGISAWVFWIEFNTTTNPWVYDRMFAVQIAVHTTTQVDLLLIANVLMKRYCGNHMGMILTEFKNLNSKHNPCTTEEEVIKCKNECMLKIFLDMNPTCRWPFLNVNLPLCKTLHEVEIIEKKLSDIRAMVAKCNCKRPCNEISYKTSISYYEIGDTQGKNTSVFAMVKSVNTKQIVTEIYTYQLSALVAELGGSIGLFLGIALTSVFELIMSLSDIAKQRKNKVNKLKIRVKKDVK